jgi:hypothetical protein
MMLNTLPSLPHSQFRRFISSLTLLALIKFTLFQPHLHQLLEFLAPILLLSTDSGSTPTEAKPNNGNLAFPPPSEPAKSTGGDDSEEIDEEKQDMRKGALEFMMTLTEANSGMVKNVNGWAAAIVRGCLEGMGTLRDEDLTEWLVADVRGRSLSLLPDGTNFDHHSPLKIP